MHASNDVMVTAPMDVKNNLIIISFGLWIYTL